MTHEELMKLRHEEHEKRKKARAEKLHAAGENIVEDPQLRIDKVLIQNEQDKA